MTHGEYGFLGYQAEFYGVGTIAVRADKRTAAERFDWMGVGISHNHAGYVEHDTYVPCDIVTSYDDESIGIHLVLDQRGPGGEHAEWHLHQDFVTTLRLKREGDVWLRPDEDYMPIARLSRSGSGSPSLLEVRASHLKDYLCARAMALYVTSYRERKEVVEQADHIHWPDGAANEEQGRDRYR